MIDIGRAGGKRGRKVGVEERGRSASNEAIRELWRLLHVTLTRRRRIDWAIESDRAQRERRGGSGRMK